MLFIETKKNFSLINKLIILDFEHKRIYIDFRMVYYKFYFVFYNFFELFSDPRKT